MLAQGNMRRNITYDHIFQLPSKTTRREWIPITIDCVDQEGREGVGFGLIEVKVLRHLPEMEPRGCAVIGPRNRGETSLP